MRVLDQVRPSDVLVLDRGYPSFDVLSMLTLHGADFVVRVPAASSFKGVGEFLTTGVRYGIVELAPPDRSPLGDMEPLRVRIVVVPRRGEAPWVLLTSLMAAEFTAEDIAAAYTLRWEIEEFHKLVAGSYFGQGFFHGRSVRGVTQEVLAQMLFVTMARMIAASAAAGVPCEHLSQKPVMLAMDDYLTRVVLRQPSDRALAHLRQILDRVARALERPRRARSCPRRSHLPERKWGPEGRPSGT